MNNIGFGIFCFGDEKYFKGTHEKIKQILNHGYHCYIFTDNLNNFQTKYTPTYVHTFEYDRSFKSYSDKIYLVKQILKIHDFAILLDADLHITDYTILKDLKTYSFNKGITYIDTLLNHNAKREFIKDLISINNPEWKPYIEYVNQLNPEYMKLQTIWEYFIVFNKDGFNDKEFYHFYERLQLAKEYSDLSMKKEINGAGEGISIKIAGKISNTLVEYDNILYDILKNRIKPITIFTPNNELPDWMK